MSTTKELIAHEKSIEDIRKYIGVDKLYFTEVDDIKKAIRKNVCTACLDGKYPIKITQKQKEFFNNDKKAR